jgi:hypothetical protein
MSPSGRFCTFVNMHILGPAVTGDNHVLADYLSNISGGQGIREIRPVEPGSEYNRGRGTTWLDGANFTDSLATRNIR